MAAVIDQHQVRTDFMEVDSFVPNHIFQDITVTVESENYLS